MAPDLMSLSEHTLTTVSSEVVHYVSFSAMFSPLNSVTNEEQYESVIMRYCKSTPCIISTEKWESMMCALHVYTAVCQKAPVGLKQRLTVKKSIP